MGPRNIETAYDGSVAVQLNVIARGKEVLSRVTVYDGEGGRETKNVPISKELLPLVESDSKDQKHMLVVLCNDMQKPSAVYGCR